MPHKVKAQFTEKGVTYNVGDVLKESIPGYEDLLEKVSEKPNKEIEDLSIENTEEKAMTSQDIQNK